MSRRIALLILAPLLFVFRRNTGLRNQARKGLQAVIKHTEPGDRHFRRARHWSNQELRKFAPLFSGSLINVSASTDMDKEGNTYQSYFTNATSYHISNYRGNEGFANRPHEILLDLEADLPQALREAFDAVFNHTTLEHIFEVRKAMANLCAMSRDIVIVVVPFMQRNHFRISDDDEDDSYWDFWRFTPRSMRKMFQENGFTVLYESATSYPLTSVYLFYIASRHPERWSDKIHCVPLSYGVGKYAIPNHPLYRGIRRWSSKLLEQIEKQGLHHD